MRRSGSQTQAPAATGADRTDGARVDDLEARIAHLEQLVEGLQDSVHRETTRQGKLIAEVQAQVQPAAIGTALDKEARDRGL
jgi:hypothetical protein